MGANRRDCNLGLQPHAAIAAAIAANAAAALLAPPGPTIAIPAPAAGVANQLPDDWVAQLWRYCVALGQARPSGLLTLNQNNDFQKLKMTDVGIDRNTISRFYAHVERVNRQRTIPMRLWKHPRMRAASAKSSHLERVDSTPVSTSQFSRARGATCV